MLLLADSLVFARTGRSPGDGCTQFGNGKLSSLGQSQRGVGGEGNLGNGSADHPATTSRYSTVLAEKQRQTARALHERERFQQREREEQQQRRGVRGVRSISLYADPPRTVLVIRRTRSL